MPDAETSPQVAGTLDEAIINGRRMLGDHPDMALAQAHAILKRDSRNTDALRLAAAAHRALGQPEQAERAEIAAIHHSQQVPALVAAAKALDEGRAGDASRLAAEHLRATPGDLAALTLSAESALAIGLAEKAEPLLRTVHGRAPGFLAARMMLINVLVRQDKLAESRALLGEFLAQRPDDGDGLKLLARIETDLGDQEATARTYERLLKTADGVAETWVLYGDALRFAGRKVESRIAYQRALAIDPAFGQAWWSLVNLDPAAVSEEMIAEMEQALAARAGRTEHEANLHFALGAAHDAHGNPADAFPHFAAGNALRRASQPYDPDELSGQIDRHIAAMPPRGLPPRRERGPRAAVPIFIIGMPRSGSTLVERILGLHSMIEGLGELPIVPHIVESLKLEEPDAPVELRIADLPKERLQAFAERYLDRAGERRRTDRPFFVDKLHMNWRHLPLIMRMLPEARVIDVRRGAMDCCWSNYKLLFARGHAAAADLGDLGRFFTDYVRLMEHIEQVASGRVHRLRYEALVDDVEGETRRLLDYVGLPFETGCIDFHLSEAPVATASSEQVRRPLNRDGIGAWRAYEQWLDPLKRALGPLAEA